MEQFMVMTLGMNWNLWLESSLQFQLLRYLFKPHLDAFKIPPADSKEFELVKKFVSVITSFIVNGDPNNDEHLLGVNFEPVSSDGESLMCFDFSNDSMKMIEFPENQRMKFWDQILKEAHASWFIEDSKA